MLSNFIAFGALIVSIGTFYINTLPDESILTINVSSIKKYKNEKYYKLFVYNNNKAPCFEFTLNYNKNDFTRVLLMKDYEKSSIFNADFDGRTISFPAMKVIPITSNWLGYLDRTEMAYFKFYPKDINTEKKISVSCIDYEKEIVF